MSFRFTLAPLLRLRQSIERQRILQLQEANLKASAQRKHLPNWSESSLTPRNRMLLALVQEELALNSSSPRSVART